MITGFVVGACMVATAVTTLVAPGLTAATARNVLLALAIRFAVGLVAPPSVAWVPSSCYLALC